VPRSPVHSLVALLLLALATPSSATTMRHLDTRGLTLGSSQIVVGTVENVQSRWSADHHKIFTDVSVRVSQSLKGVGSERLTLTQLGGELDGMRYSIPGGPLFRPGEEALLFVWRDPQGRAQVNGLAQGKFDITRDAKTGRATVQRSTPGFAIHDARSLSATQAVTTGSVSLDDLEDEIRRTLAGEGGR